MSSWNDLRATQPPAGRGTIFVGLQLQTSLMKHVFAIGRDVAPMRIVERAFAARFLVVKAEEIAQKLGALALRFQSYVD